jgi:formate-dependent phosphoribosylglycinamide formyltransferase (GAR transformylase)
VAHVVLAEGFNEDKKYRVNNFDLNGIRTYVEEKGYDGDIWYFGKPDAYPQRRMGLAVGFHKDISCARKIAEDVAHQAEKLISFER